MSGHAHSRQLGSKILGDELRAVREERGHPLRVVAAAAEMDPAILSKVETGKRMPTAPQLLAIAEFLKIPGAPLEVRRVAAEVKRRFGDNPVLAEAAWLLHEEASEYPAKKVSAPLSKRPLKKRKKTYV